MANVNPNMPPVWPVTPEMLTYAQRCVLLMNNFKIRPGCYHHKITITKSGNNYVISHNFYKLVNDTNNNNDEYDILMNAVKNKTVYTTNTLPTYSNNYTDENNESFNFIITGGSLPGNYYFTETNVLKINKCSIKTQVTA